MLPRPMDCRCRHWRARRPRTVRPGRTQEPRSRPPPGPCRSCTPADGVRAKKDPSSCPLLAALELDDGLCIPLTAEIVAAKGDRDRGGLAAPEDAVLALCERFPTVGSAIAVEAKLR